MRGLLFSLGMLVSSMILSPASALAQSTGLFSEYTALATPRADLPIGALWIPSTGPDGVGNPENVTISRGVSSTTLNSSLRRQIGLGLGNLLGISASGSAIRSVTVEGIEIHRVADFGRLTVNAGQQVLYEGIKAQRIVLTLNSDSAATLNATATAATIPVIGNVVVGNTRQITIDGSNLFLAYQVVGFGNPQVATVERAHRGSELTLNNTYRFSFCACHDNGDIDIRTQNLMSPRLDGTYETQTRRYRPSQNGWIEIALPRYLRNNRLTAASATIRYMENRRPLRGVTNSQGQQVYLVDFPEFNNRITLRTTTFRIQRVSNPSATY